MAAVLHFTPQFAAAQSCPEQPIGKSLFGENEPAAEAILVSPTSLVGDRSGNIFFVDPINWRGSPHLGRRITPVDNPMSLVRLPDGGVAAAVNSGLRYIRLGLDDPGDRVPLIEGPPGLQRVVAGGFLYAFDIFTLFRRSQDGGHWGKHTAQG